MSEALVQALIVLVKVFITAGLGAVLANLTVLNGVLGTSIWASFAIPAIAALISAALKYIGGPTSQPAAGTRTVERSSRPGFFSV